MTGQGFDESPFQNPKRGHVVVQTPLEGRPSLPDVFLGLGVGYTLISGASSVGSGLGNVVAAGVDGAAIVLVIVKCRPCDNAAAFIVLVVIYSRSGGATVTDGDIGAVAGNTVHVAGSHAGAAGVSVVILSGTGT